MKLQLAVESLLVRCWTRRGSSTGGAIKNSTCDEIDNGFVVVNQEQCSGTTSNQACAEQGTRIIGGGFLTVYEDHCNAGKF